MKKSKNLDKKAYQSLLLSGVFWGFVPLFYKKSLLAVSIILFLAIRFTIAATVVFISERKKFIKIKPKLLLAIIGFAIIDMLLINIIYSIGIQKTTILHAAIISLLNPFLVYLFAAIILKERPHKIVLVGSSVAVVGLLGIVLSSIQSTTASAPSTIVGDAILSLGAVVGAFTVVIGRKLLSQKKRIPPEQLGFLEYTVAAIPFIVIATVTGAWGVVTTLSIETWLWIVAASVLSGSIPVVLYYRSVRRLPAERLADISFVIPAVSGAVGIAFMGESLTLGFVVGTAIVITGLLISHKKLHPILVAHKLGSDIKVIEQVFRQPKKAYAYITIESKNFFSK